MSNNNMIRSGASQFIFAALLQACIHLGCGTSVADPLVVNPPIVDSGAVAVVSGSEIQPGARVLVWGGSSLVGSVNLAGTALDVAISGNHAYVAAGSAGVHVVDITDPANPGQVTSIAINGYARSIHIAGNHAYVGGGAGGLEIIDITEPESPLLLTNSSQTGNATDAIVSASYAYVANGQQQMIAARLSELTSLALYVPLNDRIAGGIGTSVDVRAGPGNLRLAEIDAGNLVMPSINYNVENNFGSNGGTMVFPGGTVNGPLIVGDREDYKALLNFGSRPAIISFWLDSDASLSGGGAIVSAGPHGPLSLASGGWSAFTGFDHGKIRFMIARKNHPTDPDCMSFTPIGSISPVTDGNRHHVIIVYDPQNEALYLYTDGVKGGVGYLAGCRADTEGDDSGAAPGRDTDWFTIGEAGQIYNGHLFYSGTVQDLYIFTPQSIPAEIDAIVREWYTLGMPGQGAVGKL